MSSPYSVLSDMISCKEVSGGLVVTFPDWRKEVDVEIPPPLLSYPSPSTHGQQMVKRDR